MLPAEGWRQIQPRMCMLWTLRDSGAPDPPFLVVEYKAKERWYGGDLRGHKGNRSLQGAWVLIRQGSPWAQCSQGQVNTHMSPCACRQEPRGLKGPFCDR